MADIKLNINTSKVLKDGTCPILLYHCHNSKRKTWYTKICVKESEWDKAKQKIKDTKGKPDRRNHILTAYKQAAQNAIFKLNVESFNYSRADANKAIDEALKVALKPEKETEFEWELIYKKWVNWPIAKAPKGKGEDAARQENSFAYNTLRNYRNSYNKFIEFLDEYEIVLTSWEDFNEELLQTLINWGLQNRESPKHIIKYFRHLRRFLNYIHSTGIPIDEEVRSYQPAQEKTFSENIQNNHYFYKEEIEALENLRNGHLFSYEEKALDLMLHMIRTGFHIGDKEVTKANLRGDSIVKERQKIRGADMVVPATPRNLEILEKYNYQLPKMTHKDLNIYIKRLCVMAGINREVEVVELKGTEKVKKVLPMSAYAKAITCRKTCATILSQSEGITAYDIMDQLGHKSIKEALSYIGRSGKDRMERMIDAGL